MLPEWKLEMDIYAGFGISMHDWMDAAVARNGEHVPYFI